MAISDFVKSLTKSSLLAHLKNVDQKTMKWRKDLLDAVVTKDELEDWSGSGGIDHGELGGLTHDDHTQYLLAAGTRALTGDWDAGSYEIRAKTLESDVTTGTAPLTIASTTVVTNLNADLLDGDHTSEFFHNDVSGEINAVTVKSPALGADIVLIEDSAATWAKKKVTLTDVVALAGAGGTDADAIHDNVAGEINAIAAKADPVDADVLVIEDSEDTWNKKKITFSEFSTADHDHNSDYISILDDAIAGNFASLTHGGEISDSGYDASDFALYGHSHTDYVLRNQWLANGFIDPTESTLAWSDANRTLTIDKASTSFRYFHDGILYTVIEAKSKQIDDTEGLWVFYFDGATLSAVNSPTDTQIEGIIEDECIVAFVYWDATNNDGRLFDERHGYTMSPMTHHYLHDVLHAQYDTGMTPSDVLSDQSGDLDTHAQFGLTEGKFYDEDYKHTCAAVASNVGLEVYYFDGADLRWTTNAGYSVLTTGSGRLAYNNSGAQTEIGDNKFVLCHVFGTNIKTDAGADKACIAVQGQAEYDTLTLARAGANTEINSLYTGDLPMPELIPVATFIFQTKTSYGNAVNARIRKTDTGDDYVDWRGAVLTGSGGASASDHGMLAGLSDDDHTQYILAAGTRGLTGDWDAGTYEIRANTFESDVAAGTAPFTVASNTVVTNLNADLLDGEEASAFADAVHDHDSDYLPASIGGSPTANHVPIISSVAIPPPTWGLSDSGITYTNLLLASGTVALTADWDAGGYEIRAQTLESDVATGTAPLTIASTTVCTNLNADLLDGYHSTTFATVTSPTFKMTVKNATVNDFTALTLVFVDSVDGGVPTIKKADADSAAKCRGMLLILAEDIDASASGSAIFFGYVSGLSGLTAGAIQYVSTTDGEMTETAPSASGDIVRVVGYAISTTEMMMIPDGTWIEKV